MVSASVFVCNIRWLRFSECTSALPPPLNVFANICADMTLQGCNETVIVGLRFASSDAPFAEVEIDTGDVFDTLIHALFLFISLALCVSRPPPPW